MKKTKSKKSKYKTYTKSEIKQLMLEQKEFQDYIDSYNYPEHSILKLILINNYFKNFKSKVPDREGERVVIINGKVVVL